MLVKPIQEIGCCGPRLFKAAVTKGTKINVKHDQMVKQDWMRLLFVTQWW